MPDLPKRFVDRAKPALRKYQKIIGSAHTRDVNESDTAVIVSDFLNDVLGYDKYRDVTTEFAIRSTFCDLAVTLDGHVQYLIEVKSIGTDLKDNHLKQAVDYGANQGVEWIVLTNAAVWQVHRIRFEQPIQHERVFEVDLLDANARPLELLQKLYLISREAANAGAIDEYWRRKEATSRYVLAQLILSDESARTLRRRLRRLFDGISVSEEEIEQVLRTEVLKRDALEGEKAEEAARLVRRAERRRARAASDRLVGGTAPLVTPRAAPPPGQHVPHATPA